MLAPNFPKYSPSWSLAFGYSQGCRTPNHLDRHSPSQESACKKVLFMPRKISFRLRQRNGFAHGKHSLVLGSSGVSLLWQLDTLQMWFLEYTVHVTHCWAISEELCDRAGGSHSIVASGLLLLSEATSTGGLLPLISNIWLVFFQPSHYWEKPSPALQCSSLGGLMQEEMLARKQWGTWALQERCCKA